jgi:hypothetical protein
VPPLPVPLDPPVPVPVPPVVPPVDPPVPEPPEPPPVEPPVIDVPPVRLVFGSLLSLEQPATDQQAALPATTITEIRLVVRIGNVPFESVNLVFLLKQNRSRSTAERAETVTANRRPPQTISSRARIERVCCNERHRDRAEGASPRTRSALSDFAFDKNAASVNE